MDAIPQSPLRRGWTTGACAAAAVRAAYTALLSGHFPDPVRIVLPGGQAPDFALALEGLGKGWARAGIIKDAGDDPDVTHGALIIAEIRHNTPGSGVRFVAGTGVGTVTRPGLPIAPGQPAINPVPREMIAAQIAEIAHSLGGSGDVVVEISVPGGAEMAQKTWNPRLGIIGGISILGTTGIVIPYSCSAWIHSIHSGIDVARAEGSVHIGAATGKTSEAALKALLGLPDHGMIDMGDFAGGMLKYLRRNPVPRISIAGGFAKLVKLAQGLGDLHSARGTVDFDRLAARATDLGAPENLATEITQANTANQVLELAQAEGLALADAVALAARAEAQRRLADAPVAVEIIIIDRQGTVAGRAGFEAGDA
ncbi:MAG: cobalt-precorrin-5B (C(1))-methyltransferase [Alphaproteobacteria bacterium]